MSRDHVGNHQRSDIERRTKVRESDVWWPSLTAVRMRVRMSFNVLGRCTVCIRARAGFAYRSQRREGSSGGCAVLQPAPGSCGVYFWRRSATTPPRGSERLDSRDSSLVLPMFTPTAASRGAGCSEMTRPPPKHFFMHPQTSYFVSVFFFYAFGKSSATRLQGRPEK